jgi:putative sigma-54 modulation protein
MQIEITNDGIEATEALKQIILDKFNKHLGRITDETTLVHVTLSKENLEQVVKALIHDHGIKFYADSKAKDLYAAIDDLLGKLESQLSKHKQKEQEKRRDNSEQFDIEKDNSKEL